MKKIRYAVIGGGINGLAVARQLLLDNPDAAVTLFEKEAAVAQHQSRHNSGVVHAGLYYEPGGLKATLCRRGVALMEAYCLQNELPYDKCGKVVVALEKEELPRLDAIHKKAVANGVQDVRLISAPELREIEPNCVGLRALHSPHTAIVSYGEIAQHIAKDIIEKGASICLNAPVRRLQELHSEVFVELENGEIHPHGFDHAVACAGLQSDRLAYNSGDLETPKIVPFFGQYYVIDEAYKSHVKGLIYPVPDPRFPFLGVHFTKRIDGQMTIGPNAFISLGRENYSGERFSLRDIADYLSYPGFWKFASRNVPAALRELKTVASSSTFVLEAAKYVPSLANVGVTPAARGIRAQAMEHNGSLVDDFVIRRKGRITHIRNAPSPGATSSFAIAEYIVRNLEGQF
ncbi:MULTISPECIES: L-2-hydroxyglutarate oxidase [unclassified Herbaspirillum]|uniref:L-2-hydroxyglutarate oxidase n=1 Tax=unclassified Herbaspirillum TaxID=2624150 RepID=UPI000E2F9D16|nr:MULTISPECIES: L-2-hydroxyglutarate oxidase [unclassified Herbaspirillum]RFB71330.1 L-2-hydroxyglutarate oxidase [Herbaspirillum sp. 3R-3a1]TFI08291.1 L-2-hydroxyglutarate oxidase [Herbaspirillum sp. 3R11]TFI14706.1 L-2-hydroxyglutarate oxidase [Herbaspirillum sp. 3R-11]TFI31902.1 L-2-hydroxyglutarate oxidase [Herbaspirillum sp. 3C11]TFI32015.1 L-2-hydroxyglutarate oxidase [Herbaspirillum sp. 3C11]